MSIMFSFQFFYNILYVAYKAGNNLKKTESQIFRATGDFSRVACVSFFKGTGE